MTIVQIKVYWHAGLVTFRRWPDIKTALGECPVFAGIYTTVKFETWRLI